MAYADDVAIYLRGVDQLPAVRRWVALYEIASGAATNWKKTKGLLMGTLRRPLAQGPVCLITPPRTGDLRNVEWHNADGPSTMRYLGIHLGGDKAVEKQWRDSIAVRVEKKLAGIWARGIPRSIFGRVAVQKNLVIATAVFYMTNQSPGNIRELLAGWARRLWDLIWATGAGEARLASGDRLLPTSLVSHDTLIQDHADGGVRALAVTEFAEALRMTWIRRLMDPAPQLWKALVWEYIEESYGWLRQGTTILTSTVDFKRLPEDMPALFREALITFGSLPTMEFKHPKEPKFHEIVATPILYSPSMHREGATVDPPQHIAAKRSRNWLLLVRQEKAARTAAEYGLTHVRHLLPFLKRRGEGSSQGNEDL